MLVLQVSSEADFKNTKFAIKGRHLKEMRMQPERKTALITGSGRNIGRGVAHELASSGHNIIVNGSNNRDSVSYTHLTLPTKA